MCLCLPIVDALASIDVTFWGRAALTYAALVQEGQVLALAHYKPRLYRNRLELSIDSRNPTGIVLILARPGDPLPARTVVDSENSSNCTDLTPPARFVT